MKKGNVGTIKGKGSKIPLDDRTFMARRADPSMEVGDHYARWNKSLDRIDNIHKKKSHDYANRLDRLANFRVGEKIGIPAALMCYLRCLEKDQRKSEVMMKGSKSGDMCPKCGEVLKDESLMDTCYDDTVLNLLFIELWEDFREHPNFGAIMGHFKQIKKHLEDPTYGGEEMTIRRCAHDLPDPENICTVGRSEPCAVYSDRKGMR